MAANPCETPLMEKNSNNPPKDVQPSKPSDPGPETTPADTDKVAFSLGGSEEADLDVNEMDTKDLDIGNGETFL